MAENGYVGDKCSIENFKLATLTYHKGGTHIRMKKADRQLGLPRADWDIPAKLKEHLTRKRNFNLLVQTSRMHKAHEMS